MPIQHNENLLMSINEIKRDLSHLSKSLYSDKSSLTLDELIEKLENHFEYYDGLIDCFRKMKEGIKKKKGIVASNKHEVLRKCFNSICNNYVNGLKKVQPKTKEDIVEKGAKELIEFGQCKASKQVKIIHALRLLPFLSNHSWDKANSLLTSELKFSDNLSKIFQMIHEQKLDCKALIDILTNHILDPLFYYIEDRCFSELEELFKTLERDNSNTEKIKIRLGFGGFSGDIPSRILSYIIPVIFLAKNIKQVVGSHPSIELFSAKTAAIILNEMDEFQVNKNMDCVEQLAMSFIDKFESELLPSVSFIPDYDWQDDKFKAVLDFLTSLLKPSLLKASENIEVLENIRSFGLNTSGEVGKSNSHKYAAYHTIVFTDIPSISHYLGRSVTAEHVITLGGKAEKSFSAVRRYLTKNFTVDGFNEYLKSRGNDHIEPMKKTNALSTRATIIMDVGDKPPYFCLDLKEELTLKHFLEPISKDVLRRNMELLLNIKGELALKNHSKETEVLINKYSSIIKAYSFITQIVPVDEYERFLISQAKKFYKPSKGVSSCDGSIK